MTQDPSHDPSPARKLLSRAGTKVRLALASSLILVAGSLIAPTATPTTLAVPQEHAAPLLEEQAQRQEGVAPFRGVQDVARQVVAYTVTFAPTPTPTPPDADDPAGRARELMARFGVFVSETRILSHEDALDGRTSVSVVAADGRTLTAELTAYEADSGLVWLTTPAAGARPAPVATSQPEPGALVVGAGQTSAGVHVVPAFIAAGSGGRFAITSGDGAIAGGTPIFDLDGRLAAVAAGPGRGAYEARPAIERLMALAASGRPQSSVGVSVQDLTARLSRIFGAEGALVNDVVAGGPADRAGIRPGDVMVRVGAIETATAEAAVAALRSLPAGEPAPLRLVREGRTINSQVGPLPAFDVAVLARSVADARGALAGVLFPPSVLAAANLAPDVEVLSLNGRSILTAQAAARELARSRRPIALRVRTRGRIVFTAIDPAR